MAAPLDLREAEKPGEAANDAQVPIEPEKEENKSAEKKKGTNGFLVSLAGELMAEYSSKRVVADEPGAIYLAASFHLRRY
jgi:ATP-binding cassette subfamily B (MDR/TAP) protein 1